MTGLSCSIDGFHAAVLLFRFVAPILRYSCGLDGAYDERLRRAPAITASINLDAAYGLATSSKEAEPASTKLARRVVSACLVRRRHEYVVMIIAARPVNSGAKRLGNDFPGSRGAEVSGHR